MDKAEKQIATDLTIGDIYPHTDSVFHYFMGFASLLVILPATVLLFPFLVAVKIPLLLLVYLPLMKIRDAQLIKKIVSLKNGILAPFHFIIFKLYYAYMAIWLACFYRFDDYWFGIDISGYRDLDHYMSSYRDSRVRWRFKKKLKTYHGHGITEEVVPDHLVFFRVLLSPKIFLLVGAAAFRKNSVFMAVNSMVMILRDYLILLFLPVRLHVYEKEGEIVGLATYLRRGNTMIMCQHIIADGYVRSGMFYKHMHDCIGYAFGNKEVTYISCAFTTRQAKETSGCYPINYLMTDEFRCKPFAAIERI